MGCRLEGQVPLGTPVPTVGMGATGKIHMTNEKGTTNAD